MNIIRKFIEAYRLRKLEYDKSGELGKELDKGIANIAKTIRVLSK